MVWPPIAGFGAPADVLTGMVSYDIMLVGGDMVAISLPGREGVLDWTLPMEGKGLE